MTDREADSSQSVRA